MNTPPLLLGAALLFWGFETGSLPLGAALALIIEGSRIIRWRWDPGLKEFSRVSDLCGLLLVVLTVYFYLTRPAADAFQNLVRTIPLTLFPVVLAQALSLRGAVDAGALFSLTRRRGPGPVPGPFVDVTRPFLAVCIMGAAAANVRTPVFYAGTVLLFSWLFWPARPGYSRAYIRILLLALAGLLGYAGQAGLADLQTFLEGRAITLFYGNAEAGTDPYHSHTAMGDLGAIKQYGNIILRVQHPAGGQTPRLLREASFDSYRSGEWRASEAPFSVMPPQAAGQGWIVSRGAAPEKFRVFARFPKGKGLFALPGGARAILSFPDAEVSRNRLGAVRADEAPQRGVYEVAWDPSPGSSRDSPPGRGDMVLPDEETALLKRISGGLGLRRMPADRALKTLGAYFYANFCYSLYQAEGNAKGVSPVARFLTQTHAGHCEFFATASVLLLRAAGIPARYAVGYSVQEYSRLQKAFLVRQRHAHAWALAYVDGAWHDVDNTPPSWFDEEGSHAGMLEPLGDAWSWLVYVFSTLRMKLPSGGPAVWLLAGAAILILYRGARGLFGKSARRSVPAPAEAPSFQGMDSELFEIEKQLAASGLGRRPSEPMCAWARRLGGSGAVDATDLEKLAALHSRLRFDPEGLPVREREALREGARACLRKLRARG